MFHQRVTGKTFGYIVERVRKRLSGRKAKTLSKAVKAILIKSTSTAIPFYTMQAAKLPSSVLEELEKLNRNFFWGDGEGQRKIHTLAWKEVCKPKEFRGLGFRRPKETNQAFLAKLAWQVQREDTALRAQVLKTKYGGINMCLEGHGKKQVSYLWKGICSSSKLLQDQFMWKMGDGNSANFWFDNWMNKSPLCSKVSDQIPRDQWRKLVRNFWNESHENWDMAILQELLPVNVLQELALLHLSKLGFSKDYFFWTPSTSGKFQLRQAYDILCHFDPGDGKEEWSRLWKFKGPSRALFSLCSPDMVACSLRSYYGEDKLVMNLTVLYATERRLPYMRCAIVLRRERYGKSWRIQTVGADFTPQLNATYGLIPVYKTIWVWVFREGSGSTCFVKQYISFGIGEIGFSLT